MAGLSSAITEGKFKFRCEHHRAAGWCSLRNLNPPNQQRQKMVAFSPVFYVTGTILLVSRHSPVRSYRDLPGKAVVVPAGTTNETAMHVLVDLVMVPEGVPSMSLLVRDAKRRGM